MKISKKKTEVKVTGNNSQNIEIWLEGANLKEYIKIFE